MHLLELVSSCDSCSLRSMKFAYCLNHSQAVARGLLLLIWLSGSKYMVVRARVCVYLFDIPPLHQNCTVTFITLHISFISCYTQCNKERTKRTPIICCVRCWMQSKNAYSILQLRTVHEFCVNVEQQMSQTSWQHELLSDTRLHIIRKWHACEQQLKNETKNKRQKSQLQFACTILHVYVVYVYMFITITVKINIWRATIECAPSIGRNGCGVMRMLRFSRILAVEIIAVPMRLSLCECVSVVHLLPHQHSIQRFAYTRTHMQYALPFFTTLIYRRKIQ